ncbi:bZIP transcription factor atfC [Aspergillus fischeri NRRL 181]|uniref:BZIP transcription factor (BACH2), putative n=1 Tax=Neosartorya fischeri (strain ATCC 1020 / DSM 3700 / CBS 544.65 / FGSC A1164 / JCM 1740 / NRRL 181 / WB 181) TaxID=331117 RepID=A1D129_NEOFI|nr:bZIP transcription factor (BACH2), putative [Aspergillus fischeri NRRL 181]EAW22122.1 bZIP transcription factor (BACH2), putative [Aspergillus fischeri NRRL 181]KAG2010812.1 hypothetical protein GB937_007579 [Aspergillus fischeri]
MTTTTLLTEQSANGNLLDWASLSPTALALPPGDSTTYEPVLLSDEDLHVLDPAFLSRRTDSSIDNNKPLYNQRPQLKPASTNQGAPNIHARPSRSSITSVSSTTSTSTSATTESDITSPKKSSKSSKRNSKSKVYDKNDPRRERYLERNRRAASKCRRQKKERNQQLENLYRKQSAEQERLLSERDRMRSELLSLKDELLKHAQCEDPPLKFYIAQMVEEAGAAVAPGRPISTYSPGYSEQQAQSLMFNDDDVLQQQSPTMKMSMVADAHWTTSGGDFVDFVQL